MKDYSTFYFCARLLYQGGVVSIHEQINNRNDIVQYEHGSYDYKAITFTKHTVDFKLMFASARPAFDDVRGLQSGSSKVIPRKYSNGSPKPKSHCNQSPFA